jgi:hypothetical protein
MRQPRSHNRIECADNDYEQRPSEEEIASLEAHHQKRNIPFIV